MNKSSSRKAELNQKHAVTQTGEEMQIVASKAPAFKAGKELREAVK
ncbi:HU family DNA-binding protein [Bacillus cereus]|nr:HU family DNA-binding protein [Bacillus thuringiensis]MCH5449170.1 HU family DNA-binding protein [Bacillus cereus]MCU5187208.1 HU family DNA-binding protein [Bacillus cereus]